MSYELNIVLFFWILLAKFGNLCVAADQGGPDMDSGTASQPDNFLADTRFVVTHGSGFLIS
jgi:hypothetical protein